MKNYKPRVGIIGIGNIGSELYKRVKSKNWDVSAVVDYDGVYADITKQTKLGDAGNLRPLDKSGLVFLAIPTLDDGETAFKYIRQCLQEQIPVVTCEKGALSNHFSELERDISQGRIGYSVTVGGGSRLLRYLAERRGPQVRELHAVVNGTLNYIFDGLSRGRSLGEVIEEAKRLGYAEPGAVNPIEVINKEAIKDVPMKTAILFNLFNPNGKKLNARDIVTNKIMDSEIRALEREAQERRYIVSITKTEDREENVIWGFKHQVGDWYISAGFKHIRDNPLFRKLIPSGVDNALLISEGDFGRDGTYVISGPGAGAGPTTNSMIIDAERILGIN